MSPPVRVALLGFTPFEREHIEPALRAPRKRLPAYAVRVDELNSCNLAVVNADNAPALAQVRQQQRLASAVIVGGEALAGAGAQLARPIQMPALLQALDTLVAAAPPMSPEVQQVQDTLARLLQGAMAPRQEQALPAAATVESLVAGPAAGPRPTPGWPVITGRRATPQRGRALLVDAADDSLGFLARELAPLGLALERVAGGSEALQQLQREPYDFVFLATGDPGPPGEDGMDGFHTCRLLQRMPPALPLAPAPTLVLLLADDSALSRLRAERSGADAWLPQPWAAEALLKIVDERERWLQQAGLRA